MALIDVVKCEVNSSEFVYKFPSDNLRVGTQLIVHPSQTAFFVKGGRILDEFTSGTYTIKSDNIPLLNRLINLPFGGNTPFTAEIWFVNQIAKMDLKWGTPHPIQITDPKYGIIVPVRAFGQYGIRVTNPKIFIETLIGNMTSFNADKIYDYFKGKMIAQLSSLLTQKMVSERISVLEINAYLLSMSEYCQNSLSSFFSNYGISLIDFNFISINVPQDDQSLIKLKKSIDKAANLNIVGRDIYRMERSFDVLEKAASNNGSMGGVANMGIGMGMGIQLGNQMVNMMTQNLNTNIAPPPPPLNNSNYHVVINGQQFGPYDYNTLYSFIVNGQITADNLVWKQGMADWIKISSAPEFSSIFNNCPPPIPQNNI